MPIHKKSKYVRQRDIRVVSINGKEFFACPRKKRSKGNPTWSSSIYTYECDLCVHSVDKNGNSISKIDPLDGNYTPHNLWCPYEECPYKKDFEERAEKKKSKLKEVDDLLKLLQKGEV